MNPSTSRGKVRVKFFFFVRFVRNTGPQKNVSVLGTSCSNPNGF